MGNLDDLKEVCLVSPTAKHAWLPDEEDRRFKVCGFCEALGYRTDEELLEDAHLKERKL